MLVPQTWDCAHREGRASILGEGHVDITARGGHLITVHFSHCKPVGDSEAMRRQSSMENAYKYVTARSGVRPGLKMSSSSRGLSAPVPDSCNNALKQLVW
eukprot:6211343-Pleurochrysis_carterae.AAC.2